MKNSASPGRLACVLLWITLWGAHACTPERQDDTKTRSPRPINSSAKSLERAPEHALDATSRRLDVEDVGPRAPGVFIIGGLQGQASPFEPASHSSSPLGGIARVVGFIMKARTFHPGHLTLDLGDTWFEAPRNALGAERNAMIARMLARSYRYLGVSIGVPGPSDFAQGVRMYEELVETAQLEPLALNLALDGRALAGTKLEVLDGGFKVGVIGGVDPDRFRGIEGTTAGELEPHLPGAIKALRERGAQAVILLYQAHPAKVRAIAEAHPGLDFIVSSHNKSAFSQGQAIVPDRRVLDGADPEGDAVGRAHALRVASSSRQVGWLKLFVSNDAVSDEPYQQARIRAPQDHDDDVLERRERAFLWRAVSLKQGYSVDSTVAEDTSRLEADLPGIPMVPHNYDVVPVSEGQAFYIGSENCQTCHAEAYSFWKKTRHGAAFDSIKKREKEFSADCVSCHVVGFGEPGGSTVTRLEYSVKLEHPALELEKDLRHVGCESCHGPGSEHWSAARSNRLGGTDLYIKRDIDEVTCTDSCHLVPHSPRFDWETYASKITGRGHGK